MNQYSRLVHQTCFIVRRFISKPKSQLPLIITTNTDDHIQLVSKCRTEPEVKPAYKKGQVLSLKQIRLGIVGGLPLQYTLSGSYWLDRIVWIVWIVSAGSYRYRFWVLQQKLSFMSCLVCYCLYGTDGLDGRFLGRRWDVGTDISRRQNWSATVGY